MKRIIKASTDANKFSEWFSGRQFNVIKNVVYDIIDGYLGDADLYLEDGEFDKYCTPRGIVKHFDANYDPSDGRFTMYADNSLPIQRAFEDFMDNAPSNLVVGLFKDIYKEVVENEYSDFPELVAEASK